MIYLYLSAGLGNAVHALFMAFQWMRGVAPDNSDRFVAITGALVMAIGCLEQATR